MELIDVHDVIIGTTAVAGLLHVVGFSVGVEELVVEVDDLVLSMLETVRKEG